MKKSLFAGILLAALLPLSQPALAWDRLGPQDENTQTPVYRTELEKFFNGNPKANSYAEPQQGILDAFHESFSGPAQKTIALGDDSTLVSGCQAHQCAIKGAVVVARDNSIRAAALIQFNPDQTRALRAQKINRNAYEVTLFAPARAVNPNALEALLQWAKQVRPQPGEIGYKLSQYQTRLVLVEH